jgi:hypothetical protein
MIERMQAMMQPPAPPRILSAEEVVVEELRSRHGERALLIEARKGADGCARMLAVLDLNAEALAVETKLHASRSQPSPAVEVIDRAGWLVLQRLIASGMIAMMEGQSRVLHRSPDFDAAPAAAADPAVGAASAA